MAIWSHRVARDTAIRHQSASGRVRTLLVRFDERDTTDD
jgi:hypothetical protein